LSWFRVACRRCAPRGMRVGCTTGEFGAIVGWALDVIGASPPKFKRAGEAVFDFGGDVAVGLDESVGQVVAEASGLRDFGN